MTAAVSQNGFSWTDDQQAIIDLPLDARTLVVADAGTGKTAILVERLVAVLRSTDAGSGGEVLLLSFSRSAVGEISKRLRSAGGRAAYCRAATFDSFATRMLAQHSSAESWESQDYNGRIRSAVEMIATNRDAKDELRRYSHVFVDEMQDLVADRSDLVRSVLTNASGGFTLFGDPAQAIYGWQESGNSSDGDIFDWVRNSFGDSLQEHHLRTNFRAQTEIARTALQIGSDLNGPCPDYRAIRDDLIELTHGLPSIGTPAGAAPQLRRVSGPTAVLCRTNGQSLVLSQDFHRLQLVHRLQGNATDRAVAPWVASVFAGINALQLGKSNVIRRLESLESVDDPKVAWALLKRMDPTASSGLSVAAVRSRVHRGQVPDELTLLRPASLTLSTIHRAKGLEFDNVVVLEPQDRRRDDDEAHVAVEARVLYVALTRARKQIMVLPPSDGRRVFKDSVSGRWVRGGPQKWQTFGFEIRPDDVDKTHPAGGHLLDGIDASETQEYLWSKVEAGDPLELQFLRETRAGAVCPFYSVMHQNRPIGVTSGIFGVALHRRLHPDGSRGRWPTTITNLHVESIDTVAGTQAASQNVGLGFSGMWLRVRPVGLGDVEW